MHSDWADIFCYRIPDSGGVAGKGYLRRVGSRQGSEPRHPPAPGICGDKSRSARFLSTAHGLYHAFLSVLPVGRGELTPGWTSYHKRLLYQTYEVTDLLRTGPNALGIALGAGWYKGLRGYKHTRNNCGIRTAFGGQPAI